MTTTTADPLLRFLKDARRRFWVADIIDTVVRAFWATSALLLASGLVHTFVYALPWAFCIGVAAAPPAFALLAGLLLRRPSLAAAAHKSDRSFGTLELFASAWEQLQIPSSQRGAVTALVLARARHSAGVLRSRLGRTIRWRFSRSGLLPLGIAVLGLLLLLVPGAHTAPPVAATAGAGAASPAVARKHIEADAVAALQRELASFSRDSDAAATPAPGEAAATDAIATHLANAPADGREARRSEKPPLPDDAAEGAPGEPAGDSPGVGRGGTRADEPSPPPATLTIRYHDLPARLEAAATPRERWGTPEDFEPLENLPSAASEAEGSAAPSEAAATRHAPGFPPTLRTYIANYFKSIESPQ